MGDSGPSGTPYEEIDNLSIRQIERPELINYPYFPEPLGHIKIHVDKEQDLLDSHIYYSPRAYDPEGDKIIMSFDLNNKAFLSAT